MRPEPQAPLVLVADDNAGNLQFLGRVLDEAGYEVMPAIGGEQAVSRARARKPDLVLLDMRMPGMDGGSTCRALRQAGLADVPILFVTAAAERHALMEAFAAGAVDYIVKPFGTEELLARIRTHLELKLARDRLALMLQERQDVMHVVAHDLKNPLSATLFAAQLMRSSGDPQRRAGLLDDIVASSEEALRFIQRFLARGAEGRRLREFCAQPLALHEIASAAVASQRPVAEVRGMRIEQRGAAGAFADRDATRNAVVNLLSNALRYAPAGSLVEIEIGNSRAGMGWLRVLDRGPGVSAEQQARLFRSFVRLIAAKSEMPSAVPEPELAGGSSGLGLAIAKHDIAQMGGHLWYEPRGGGGAIFTIELPQQREQSGALS